MARAYKPSTPYTVAFKVLVPTWSKTKGVPQKTYPSPSDVERIDYCSFKTYGGTEITSNDLYVIEDTAWVETWYTPLITSDCRIYICDTGEIWDVISRPENIEMRNQYLKFKAKLVGGKV